MAEMTLEQRRAVALASARLRLQEQASKPPRVAPTAFEREAEATLGSSLPERISANPAVRTLTSAARPVLGVADLIERLWGGTSNRDRLEQLDEMQRRGNEALGLGGAGLAADVSGALLSPVTALAAKAPAVAGYIPKVLQAASIGGIAGLTAGTDAPLTAGGVGGAVGGAIPGVGIPLAKGLQTGYRALIEPILNPAAIKGRAYLGAAGDKLDDIISLLRGNRQIVPGSAPTAGEAAAPAGSAEFSALQKSAERAAPSRYVARADEQNAARLAQVRTVGQDKAALEAAQASRAANAAESYGPIMSQRVNPASDIQIMEQAIAGREASKAEALRDAGRFATTEAQMIERGQNVVPVPGMPRVPARVSDFPERAAEAGSAARDATSIAVTRRVEEKFLENTMERLRHTVGLDNRSLGMFLKRPSMREAVKAAIKGAEETGGYFPRKAGDQFSVQNLQRMKEALDDAVVDPATFGIKATEAREISATRNAFVDWLSNKVPAWRDARLQYTADSAPINQMQVGQYLEGKLVPALSDEAKQKAATYAGALRDAPGTIKRATGAPRFDQLAKILTPKQMDAVNSVRDDLARSARFESLAKAGGGSANALDVATASMEQAVGGKVPNPLNRHIMVFNQILNRLEGKINKKLAAEIAVEMLNPPQVAESLAQAAARQKRNQMLAEQVRAYARPSIAVGVQQKRRTDERPRP